MLTATIRKMALLGFLGLFAAGCVEGRKNPETRHREDNANSIATVSLVLEQAIIRDNGTLELSIAYVNDSNRNVCIPQRAKDNSYVNQIDIIAPAKGLVVFSQDDNEGISEVPDYTPSEWARIKRENRHKPFVIKPKGSLHIKSELAPIHSAYFADSRGIYVRKYRRGTPLSVVASALFYFDCKDENLNKALDEERTIYVKSNAVKLVGNVGAFVSSKP